MNESIDFLCMAKKLQLRVCKTVSVESAVLFCRWACICSLFVYPHPFLTAKSSNAARPLRAAFTWTWQLMYTFTPIYVISFLVCSQVPPPPTPRLTLPPPGKKTLYVKRLLRYVQSSIYSFADVKVKKKKKEMKKSHPIRLQIFMERLIYRSKNYRYTVFFFIQKLNDLKKKNKNNKRYPEQNGEDYFSCHDVWMYVLLPPCYHPV